MIHFVEQGFLDSDCNVLAHIMNSESDMSNGIANEISSKYPLAAIMDKEYPYSPSERLGRLSFAYDEAIPILIFNLYAKDGNRVDYRAFNNTVIAMFNIIQTIEVRVQEKLYKLRLGFPNVLGDGVTDYERRACLEILDHHSKANRIDIHIYNQHII